MPSNPTKIEKEFTDLVAENGALACLGEHVRKITVIVQQYVDEGSEIEERLIGHTGLNGEFGNGLVIIASSYALYKFAPDARSLEDCINTLFEIYHHPSQISKTSKERARELYQNEITGDAVPRALREIKDWAKSNNNIPQPLLAELTVEMNGCTKALEQFKLFIETYADMKPQTKPAPSGPLGGGPMGMG